MERQDKSLPGLILRSQGGFYQVRTPGGDYQCRGRGRFRKEALRLLVGDRVEIRPTGPDTGFIVELIPRDNFLIRPPVANLTRLALVVSAAQPSPNLLVADKLTAIAVRRNIPVELVFTKSDLADTAPLAAVYRQSGFPVYRVDSLSGQGVGEVREAFSQGVTAFCGNSGAGKSTLLGALFPHLDLATGEISKKLGRGRHTTRHVELFPTGAGGYIADTPGFSAVDLLQSERMTADQLAACFPEFAPYAGDCRFTGCSHRVEKGCAVLSAVQRGEIPRSRHQSYLALYEELKEIKDWQLNPS